MYLLAIKSTKTQEAVLPASHSSTMVEHSVPMTAIPKMSGFIRTRSMRMIMVCRYSLVCELLWKRTTFIVIATKMYIRQLQQISTNGFLHVLLDMDKCNGCGWCIEACDYGAIMLHPETKVVHVCDLCKDEGEPQCIKWCPEEALTLVTSDVLAQKARISAVKKLFQQAKKK